jgi:hypothetical protein
LQMLCPKQRLYPHPPIVQRSHPPRVAAKFSSSQSSPEFSSSQCGHFSILP